MPGAADSALGVNQLQAQADISGGRPAALDNGVIGVDAGTARDKQRPDREFADGLRGLRRFDFAAQRQGLGHRRRAEPGDRAQQQQQQDGF